MLTLFSFLFFTILVGVVTYWIVRRDDVASRDGYFLAGRSLTWPFIAGSLLLTNLSTEQMVGLNGSAFLFGLSVMVWEVVAVVALVFMALFFLPRFLRAGVATVPEFLEQRFDRRTGTLCNLIFLIAYAVILLPIILYSGAAGLSSILDLQALTGIQNNTVILWGTVGLIGIVGSIYALFGGLRTVAVSDTLNGIGLLVGGLMIVYFGLSFVGDGAGALKGAAILAEQIPDKFNSVGGAKHEVPFGTIFSGVLLINIFYWCTNQQIIQRTFGASSLREGQKGVLFTGLLKLAGPLYLVVPGLIAFYLYQKGVIDVGLKANGLPNSDLAYGILVRKVLPSALTGFFAAVMVGAILSSFNSALNSTCTLFSLGFYKNFIRPEASEQQIVKSGKYFGWLIAIIAMLVAPLLGNTKSIFNYLQMMNGIYFIPILAVVAVGMLSRRVPARAASWALVLGVAIIAIGYFVPPFNYVVNSIQNFHFLALVFLYLVIFMLVFGEIQPRATEYQPRNLDPVDMKPWKFAPWAGAGLLVLVVLIYVFFADFSVLK